MFKCGYLGLIVGGGEVQLEEAKVAAIRNFPIPRTKKDVRSFLGLAGYYRRFIPQFATLTANLTDLTRKEQPNKVEWTPVLASDFQTLKTQLLRNQFSSALMRTSNSLSKRCIGEGNWDSAKPAR